MKEKKQDLKIHISFLDCGETFENTLDKVFEDYLKDKNKEKSS